MNGYEKGEIGEKSGQSIWKNGFVLVGCVDRRLLFDKSEEWLWLWKRENLMG